VAKWLERWLRRYWGYALLVLLIFLWPNVGDQFVIVMVLVLSIATASYFMFQVPGLPCGAGNRKEGTFCRNNSRGLLLGCHIYQHTWQRLKFVFLGYAFRYGWDRRQRIGQTIREGIATLALIATIGSTAIAGIALAVKK